MRKSVRILWVLFFTGIGIFITVIVLAMAGAFGKLPSLKQLENPTLLQASEVFAADGTLMGKYYRERGNREVVTYREISKHVINALVAIEDERFYNHSGIDLKRSLGAVVTLGKNGGGSTITQQLAKALLGQGSRQPWERVLEKIKEYIVAIRLERNFTKEEILALYLNAVSYPDNVYGIRNASRTFFQKDPAELAPEEAALLVGSVNGTYRYNPRVHPKAAIDRRNLVLNQMKENGYLAPAEASRLIALPIKTNYKKLDQNTGYAPYFREVLKDEIEAALEGIENISGEPYDIYNDGLRVFTTINPRMQEYAEEAVRQQMPQLQRALNNQRNVKTGSVWNKYENVLEAAMKNSDRWHSLKDEGYTEEEITKTFYKPTTMRVFAWNAKEEKDTVMTPYDSIKYHRQMLQTAFVAMDPITGEVKAWVGGINFKTYKFDHANINTKRQVGSSIKPFLYCEAMEERGFTPETPVVDVQQSFGGDKLVPATGKTCTGRTFTMASALAWSRNCATAYIMKQVGPVQFANFLSQINIPTKVAPNPSIALGACELSLYEMLWGYTMFPGGGFSTKPYFISRIEDRNGNVIKRFDNSMNRKEVISEITAYNMCRMMQGPVTQGTAAGLMQRLGATEMGGKTGTTNNNADAWFMGYVPQLLAGSWIGCDDQFIRIESGLGYGGQAARPIWEAFFKKVYADETLGIDKEAVFTKPAELQNELNNADLMRIIDNAPPPNAEGENMGVGDADDYGEYDTANSYNDPVTPPAREQNKPASNDPKNEKDTSTKKQSKIGEPATMPEEKKKKNILRSIFGKKNDNQEE